MTTLLSCIIAYMIGYWWGRKSGIAYIMVQVEDLLKQLHNMENRWKNQWNEDQL